MGGGGAGAADFCDICLRPNMSSSSSRSALLLKEDCGSGVLPRERLVLYAGVLRPLIWEGIGKWVELSTGAAELKAARRSASSCELTSGRRELVSRPANGLLIVLDRPWFVNGLL